MFFNLVFRNAKRSRKENLIYFATLVTAVTSFYLILSLENQGVILYLKDFESEAVDRLFSLMPILYGFALFLLFFLVLFANRYQLDRRSKEFGMYLMMGMSQVRLFLLLLAESVLTSLLALGIGIGLGSLLAEIISLATSRLIGQGIIGHESSFSLLAVGYTILGFLAIQIVALLILAGSLSNRELDRLLYGQTAKKQNMGKTKNNWVTFTSGVLFLLGAYFLIIRYFWLVNIPMIALAVVLGIIGTILVIRGTARLLNAFALRDRNAKGLKNFTIRQLQENIANRATAITVSSILMMFSLILLAEGGSTIMSATEQLDRDAAVYDFTLQGDNPAIQSFLTSAEMTPYVSHLNPLELAYMDQDVSFEWEELRQLIVARLPEGMADPTIESPDSYSITEDQSAAENLLWILAGRMGGYLIRESNYNRLLEAAGEEPIQLKENELAVYMNSDYGFGAQPLLEEIIKESATEQTAMGEIAGEPFYLVPGLPMKDLVTDRSITIMSGLVVPDAFFEAYTKPNSREIYWNFTMPEAIIAEKGLMVPMKEASELISKKGFTFESYLQNFGRQLFYIIAGSYTMLYLSFLFLIIGCTVLALHFLTQFKQTMRRYQTLAFLGAKREQMRQSIRKQITWYFLFPLVPALISGTVGIIAMKTYIRFNVEFLPSIMKMLPFVFLMISVFLLIQYIYAKAVYKTSTRELEQLNFK
ncbi:ABC transporter permease [Jeotgalibaca porci]|uniref:ABC transporter permease n=1 Tax=Jeotgalibaca porci TaxID=1868793 RepID=A0A6G7WI85_9LACT|nr:ABC transporter permease [Jeotgalibaca porci]QIK51911.1 ABC transporter permease [Jeotgalibaca porci]